MGRSLSGGVETVHWASLDEWGSELPGGRDAGVGGLWAGLEGLCGPEGGWSAGPRAYSPASRAFLSPDPEAPDASDPATAAAYAYAGGSPLSMVDPSGGRATPAQGGWDERSWRATQAQRAVAAGVRDVAELAGIVDRCTESYSGLVCGVIVRGQRTTYTVNPHGVLNWAGMIPGVGPWADLANAGLYAWEGDWAGAGMSAAPRVFDIFRAGRAASSSTRFASRGDDMARAATRGEGFASRTWSRAKSAFRSFRDKVGDQVRWVAGSESGAATPRFGDDVARAAEGRAIGRAGDVAGIDVGRLTPSKKVLDYDYAYFNRPYNSSNLLIGEIISTGPPGPDPRGSAGMRWKVPGSLNGTEGTFEVLISPDGRTVWHFLFRSK